MKVLGISFGRKNQRSDVLVKEALFAAKAAGADVQFINTLTLNIGHCRACDYCSRMRDKGEVEIHCCMKDDYHILEEACLEADGIIIAAPVYAVGIVGQFKNFVDRFGPSHDRAALLEENRKRKEEGKNWIRDISKTDMWDIFLSEVHRPITGLLWGFRCLICSASPFA